LGKIPRIIDYYDDIMYLRFTKKKEKTILLSSASNECKRSCSRIWGDGVVLRRRRRRRRSIS